MRRRETEDISSHKNILYLKNKTIQSSLLKHPKAFTDQEAKRKSSRLLPLSLVVAK